MKNIKSRDPYNNESFWETNVVDYIHEVNPKKWSVGALFMISRQSSTTCITYHTLINLAIRIFSYSMVIWIL